eukprot:4263758-Pleurochrysis_carterae.AAC.1
MASAPHGTREGEGATSSRERDAALEGWVGGARWMERERCGWSESDVEIGMCREEILRICSSLKRDAYLAESETKRGTNTETHPRTLLHSRHR